MLTSVLAGMTPPFPALDVLKQDVNAAQKWLDQTLALLHSLELAPTGRPPDEKKKRKNVEKIKVLITVFIAF